MLIQIVESLHCTNAHARSGLVGVFTSVDARDVVTGVLGCPVCKAEYPIWDGILWFSDHGSAEPLRDERPSEEEALRLAAFLDLTDSPSFALLHGRWAVHAPLVNALSPMHLVLFNPRGEVDRSPGITIIHSRDAVPFAPGSAHAAAIDGDAPPDFVDGLTAAVRPHGRLLGPVTLALPHGTHEVARDDRAWVAERDRTDITSAIVSLGRRPRS